jgi:hypothetical protein
MLEIIEPKEKWKRRKIPRVLEEMCHGNSKQK